MKITKYQEELNEILKLEKILIKRKKNLIKKLEKQNLNLINNKIISKNVYYFEIKFYNNKDTKFKNIAKIYRYSLDNKEVDNLKKEVKKYYESNTKEMIYNFLNNINNLYQFTNVDLNSFTLSNRLSDYTFDFKKPIFSSIKVDFVTFNLYKSEKNMYLMEFKNEIH